jgi:protein required for attachment to host cells
MAATHWFLIADSSRARLFSATERGRGLTEIASFANPEGRSQEGELASYDSGISARAGPRSGPQQPSASDHRIDVFAKELARYLEQARTEHRYAALYLIAGPEFLGRLRQNLGKEVENLVAATFDKDISWFETRDIERYIEQKLQELRLPERA